MSLEALTWALYDVRLSDDTVPAERHIDALARLILIAIADQADRLGRNAIISRAELAEITGLGETTVGSRLRRLRNSGLITPGDDGQVAHLRYRAAVWDLAVRIRPMRPRQKGVATRPPEQGRGGRGGDPLPRGSRGGREGVARGSRGGRAGDDPPHHPSTHTTPPPRAAGRQPASAGGAPRVDGPVPQELRADQAPPEWRSTRDALRARRRASGA